MKRAGILQLVLAALLGSSLAGAENPFVIIVNTESGITRMTREEAVDYFMGRQKHLPSGLVALPVEQVLPEEVRRRFYALLVHLPLPQVRAYWARLYFSGQAQPPRQTDSAEETLQVVAANRGAIGFMVQTKPDRRVRVVLQLGPADDSR
jgi:hypothetical protein